MRALSIAATGMAAQQTNVEVIANNLANMNTTGYKSQIAEFEDLLYQNVEQPGAQRIDADTGTVHRRARHDREPRQARQSQRAHAR